jgi:hypothetical protein
MNPAQQNSTAAHMSATVRVAKDYGDLPLGPVFTLARLTLTASPPPLSGRSLLPLFNDAQIVIH